MERQNFDSVVKFFVSVIGIIVILAVLKELQALFIPFVIAYFLFFIFHPVNVYFEKKKVPQVVTIIFDVILMALVIWGFYRLVLSSVYQINQELPLYIAKLNHIISNTAISLGVKDKAYTEFQIDQLFSMFDVSALAESFLNTTLSFITTTGLVLFFFIFISSGHDKIYEALRNRFEEKELEKQEENPTEAFNIKDTFNHIVQQVQKYILTKFLISLLTGVIIGFILYLFDVKFFFIWALLTVFLNFIPNFGSIIAVLFPALMSLIQFDSFGYTLLILGIMITIQNLIGNILEPKVFGSSLGINPIVILISLIVWGYIWGIVGMFLSVPLTAILKITLTGTKSPNLRLISDLMSN
ncbi:MAG: AI-2E family transporter [Melioribacteraceae bacterium]|nr:AI-2E family transporter [Melioribacteraceae bacterium]